MVDVAKKRFGLDAVLSKPYLDSRPDLLTLSKGDKLGK
jgi:hypothetical protein